MSGAVWIGIYVACSLLALVGLYVAARDALQLVRATFWPPETPGETRLHVERYLRVGGTRFPHPILCHLVMTDVGITFAVCHLLYKTMAIFPRHVFIPHERAKVAAATRKGRIVLEIVDGDQVWWFEAKDVDGAMHAMRHARFEG